MKYSLVLLSAGKGTRFGKETPKQYLLLAGKPMIVHTLERVDQIEDIEEVVVVCGEEYVEKIQTYLKDYRIQKKIVFVEGGDTRQKSVFAGIQAASCEHILLHEAARPMVTKGEFIKLIQCPSENVTYTYGIPYTVLKKDENDQISGVLDRKELVNIQLPQKFNKADLLQSHLLAIEKGEQFTEDASMVYHYTKKPVYCLQGTPYNVKMTEYIDLLYGEMLIREAFVKEEM